VVRPFHSLFQGVVLTIHPAACGGGPGVLFYDWCDWAGCCEYRNRSEGGLPHSVQLGSTGAMCGGVLAAGQAPALGLFAPNYISPRSIQMNIGIQREIRHGMVLTADFPAQCGNPRFARLDINHVGSADSQYFSATGAQDAVAGAANATTGCNGLAGAAAVNCVITNAGSGQRSWGLLGQRIGYAGRRWRYCLSGKPSLLHPCAFGGINQNLQRHAIPGADQPVRLQRTAMKLVQNVANPLKGSKDSKTSSLSYASPNSSIQWLTRAYTAPSNAVAANDQDFVLQAADND